MWNRWLLFMLLVLYKHIIILSNSAVNKSVTLEYMVDIGSDISCIAVTFSRTQFTPHQPVRAPPLSYNLMELLFRHQSRVFLLQRFAEMTRTTSHILCFAWQLRSSDQSRCHQHAETTNWRRQTTSENRHLWNQ